MSGKLAMVIINDMRLTRLICRIVETAGYRCKKIGKSDDWDIDEDASLALIGIESGHDFGRDLGRLHDHTTLPLLLLGDTPYELHNAAEQARQAGMQRVRSLSMPRQLSQIHEAIQLLQQGAPGSGNNGESLSPSPRG